MPLDFFRQFVLNPLKTGAIVPSSDQLAELITPLKVLGSAKVAMELGCGTGVFTEKILNKINEKTNFIAIEINSHFVKKTQDRCPKAIVFHDTALNAKKYLKDKKCDIIVSGLPFVGFNRVLQEELLNVIFSSLSTNGKFLIFAYVHGTILPAGMRFREKLNFLFREVKRTNIVWKNLPPAFVYVCTK